MQHVEAAWFTGEHGQQLQPPPYQSQRRRPGKLPSSTQAAIDDINRQYPSKLNDDIPEL